MRSYTTLARVALMVWDALESYGCDSRRVFQAAGLDPAAMHDPTARYPRSAFRRLWHEAREASGDPCFGLTVASRWHPSNFYALGYSWLASTSLRDGFERLVRYFGVVSDAAGIILERSDGQTSLTFFAADPNDPGEDEVRDALLALIVQMCRTSTRSDFSPLRVCMTRPVPETPSKYYAFFHAPIEFGHVDDALFFADEEVDRPLPTADPELVKSSDRVAASYLASLDRRQLSNVVRAKLLDLLSAGDVTQELVADALHVSVRTMQRKLREEGTSFKGLLMETRQTLADQYIRNSELSTKEIAYLLGFSEPSNFARAFRRWKGMSPSEFREAV